MRLPPLLLRLKLLPLLLLQPMHLLLPLVPLPEGGEALGARVGAGTPSRRSPSKFRRRRTDTATDGTEIRREVGVYGNAKLSQKTPYTPTRGTTPGVGV